MELDTEEVVGARKADAVVADAPRRNNFIENFMVELNSTFGYNNISIMTDRRPAGDVHHRSHLTRRRYPHLGKILALIYAVTS